MTVQYPTAGGGAAAGRDFDALARTLTFQPGKTRTTIAITVEGDRINEDDETFSVFLAAGRPTRKIADGRGVGTILDDDPTPSRPIPRGSARS